MASLQPSFLYNSDSNLNHVLPSDSPPSMGTNLTSVSNRQSIASENRLIPSETATKATRILRPCDQYPSEPGVLKSRPVSSLSARSGSQETASGQTVMNKATATIDSQQRAQESESNKAKEGWTRVPSLKDRWRLKPRSSSQSSDKPLFSNPKVEGDDASDFHSTCGGGRVTNW